MKISVGEDVVGESVGDFVADDVVGESVGDILFQNLCIIDLPLEDLLFQNLRHYVFNYIVHALYDLVRVSLSIVNIKCQKKKKKKKKKNRYTPSRRRRNLAPKATIVLKSWWDDHQDAPCVAPYTL